MQNVDKIKILRLMARPNKKKIINAGNVEGDKKNNKILLVDDEALREIFRTNKNDTNEN